ncbi:alpha/beta fold hydrolase [Nevskia ramosa]|uniref:alpha/beta fold hydrolase n=1 Tax=Nevskia ramosa TaxID=64002 RepID=UPI00235420CE|nr:alpha/beta hydrolase [Nevskia ramosa]
MTSLFAAISHRGSDLSIEYVWIEAAVPDAPLLVFLHEGLGSVAMWRDFPAQLCAATGCRGLVYSRPAYGRSTPKPPDEHWGPDFLEIQALEALPALFAAVGVDLQRQRVILFGHSDGASIALIHAAHFGAQLVGIIVLAPHIMVEPISITSIERARVTYQTTNFRDKLARFHDDVDSAFRGWNDVWLDQRFKVWSIESLLPQINCPVLAIQGLDDEYGTMAHIDGIAAAAPKVELLKLESCGHSPHRDQPERVTAAIVSWLAKLQPSIKS